ncbi:hypothetical protein DL546_003107 [Coniochaeta pulveracea]|uniref:WLM domain-containing protein n=1 Tax=Coniochaeta pulveracea TaxID=177199 RepID=A0A420XYM3_9PEZI|nr:hypothetical protein DL546_003107 [Coniochaeta pulveracea]
MAAEVDSPLSHSSDANLPPQADEEDQSCILTVKFSPVKHISNWTFPGDATLDEFITRCDELWPEYDWNHAKLMISPLSRSTDPASVKALLKPLSDGDLPLSHLHTKTVKILAQKRSDIETLNSTAAAALAKRQAKARHRALKRTSAVAQQDATYTFHTVQPLPYLPRPERSLAFLQRLKEDPGIRGVMRKHKYSVGLLTEMDPAAYTEANHEGVTRILGLNRNKGEVIELRLRTDAGDGYRDYNTIRKTLCHELAHNVHGPHDRQFWDLCHQIEREVAAGSGGRTIGEVSAGPVREEDEEEVADHGAWEGGSYVLGGSADSAGASGTSMRPMDRREIIARAAEARMKETERAKREARERSQREGQGS